MNEILSHLRYNHAPYGPDKHPDTSSSIPLCCKCGELIQEEAGPIRIVDEEMDTSHAYHPGCFTMALGVPTAPFSKLDADREAAALELAQELIECPPIHLEVSGDQALTILSILQLAATMSLPSHVHQTALLFGRTLQASLIVGTRNGTVAAVAEAGWHRENDRPLQGG
jgi:hypothetical protein